jgi:putative flippase GtrA
MSRPNALTQLLNGLDVMVRLASRTGVSDSFIRFGMVGGIGFVWDTATVYALRNLTGLYIAGACGFLVAATANWALNRIWTYRHVKHDALHKQWLRFLASNFVGFIVNRGLYFVLILKNGTFHSYPVLAILAGSIAGIFFNYLLSKKFVFR